jgi:hypothetical protein
MVFLRDTRSADEQLAEIEAARAVPDAENAAILYEELLSDANAESLLDVCPDVLRPPAFNQRRREPWRSQDHPELAAWLEGIDTSWTSSPRPPSWSNAGSR